MTQNLKRVNLRMGQELHDWFERESTKLGIATSAYMIVALAEFKKQTDMTLFASGISPIMMNEMTMQLEAQKQGSEAVIDTGGLK